MASLDRDRLLLRTQGWEHILKIMAASPQPGGAPSPAVAAVGAATLVWRGHLASTTFEAVAGDDRDVMLARAKANATACWVGCVADGAAAAAVGGGLPPSTLAAKAGWCVASSVATWAACQRAATGAGAGGGAAPGGGETKRLAASTREANSVYVGRPFV